MQKMHKLLTTTGLIVFGISFTTAVLTGQTGRFDHKVRNDFFSGFGGNKEAFENGMKVAAETIAENPNHAEALVWHGAGMYFQAGQYFQKGDPQKGMELYQKAFAEMDRAVELAPDSVAVRIPRGAAILAATAFQPMDDRVRGELQRAIDDFQHTYDMQKTHLDKIGDHPLGQLLLGLGDGYSRLGETGKAKPFFAQMESMLPNTEYAKRAAAWKQNGKLSASEQRCFGCHVSKK